MKITPVRILALIGAIIAAYLSWGWNPPLDPRTVQQCGFGLVVVKLLIVWLGGGTANASAN